MSGSAVSAAVSYDSANNRVTINPNSNLSLGTTYVATITTGATASDGIALASNYTWTFTTIAAPTVTATTPASRISRRSAASCTTTAGVRQMW